MMRVILGSSPLQKFSAPPSARIVLNVSVAVMYSGFEYMKAWGWGGVGDGGLGLGGWVGVGGWGWG